jgi:hypothetical protein
LDRQILKDLDLYLIIHNYATPEHVTVNAGLARPARFPIHFIPNGNSWMDLIEMGLIERFFADITQDTIRGGSFTTVRQLIKALEEYLALRNQEPKRYVWKAKGGGTPRQIQRARQALEVVS